MIALTYARGYTLIEFAFEYLENQQNITFQWEKEVQKNNYYLHYISTLYGLAFSALERIPMDCSSDIDCDERFFCEVNKKVCTLGGKLQIIFIWYFFNYLQFIEGVCPKGFRKNPTSDSCYHLGEAKMNFAEAEKYCFKKHSQLLIINDDEEFDFLTSIGSNCHM